MASLIAVICLVLLFVGIYQYEEGLVVFGGIGFVIFLIVTGVCAGRIVNGRTLEAKIAMYEEELEKKSEFNTDNCTEEELIARCKELRFSEENTLLAIEFFIKKTKQSEIADKLCVEEHAISTRKLRLKKKLNKNNDN